MKENVDVAIVSAIAALSGVVLTLAGAWLSERWRRKHERLQLLQAKYEELARLLAESLAEYARASPGSRGESRQALPVTALLSAAWRIHGLAQVYFPPLRQASQDYVNACNALRSEDDTQAKAAADQLVAARKQLLDTVALEASRCTKT